MDLYIYQALILEHVNATLFGGRVFADVIRVKILISGDYPRLSGWAVNAFTGDLTREGA